MSNKSLLGIIVLLAALIVGWNSFFVVNQTERAIVLQFGRVVDSDVAPGLHFKLPFVQEAHQFDGRLLTLDTATQRYLTLEKKALMVDSYAKWRIADVQRFYTATSGLRAIAEERLSRQLESGLRNEVARRTLHEVVSGERDQLMADITATLDESARRELGIEVVDVRVKAIDLPNEVNRSVFDRMSTEREREAREHRAKGRELGEGIRADADRQKRVIIAEAFRESEKIRGDGDAKAAKIYAEAYTKDPEFYAFSRSLQAYRESFASKSDVLVLDPESDFFKYLQGKSRQP
ncbi:protease modulator HflC [Pseudomonas neustonica]|uniref:Protein HflC n=1 Tax=Pseudomonas neustonica TaxID=2487346 RepID=A0ABX9XPI4_9PSED|nr:MULTISPECIES: protease modulator HflC [Pseudomonas]MAB23177.1 HflC protein [Pseudomonadales bacterium]MBA6419693.1 protease modulator HflC [Pseudomonas sp. 5Ae-yellow]ROZ87165.1 protease modulator HflC [Pseudomonas sp. SSM44]ROZ88219.1 protease modulator HflC [Pseudomonas neustonica]|tara:strand:+ start:5396 stop:6271 length:876 start_codon:yes stop_codon:yes gene_type:complete